MHQLNVYYVNVNGFKSKSDSMKQILEECNVHILLLTETKVYSKTAIKIEGFQMFPAVRPLGLRAWFISCH